jgi:glycerol-3-phosphate dehydrogenase
VSKSDIIIIGGGVQGLTLAILAAERGLRAHLIERGAFGSGGSCGMFGDLDCGFRNLQKLRIGRLRRAGRGQDWFRQRFPTLVRPLACLTPLDGRGLRRPIVFDLALSVERATRRADPNAEGRVLSPGRTASFCPWLRSEKVAGAACWYESVAPDVPEFVAALVGRARAAGATLQDGVEAEALRLDGDSVAGVLARDHKRFARLALQAPVVVNCTGGEAAALARRLDSSAPALFEPALSFNLLLDRAPAFAGALVLHGATRLYCLRPFKGKLLAGAGYVPAAEGARWPTPPQIEALRAELAEAARGLNLRDSPVLQAFSGLVPGNAAGDGPAEQDILHDHATHGGPHGLVTMAGAESGAAPELAAEALALLQGRPKRRAFLPQAAGRLYERIVPGGAR